METFKQSPGWKRGFVITVTVLLLLVVVLGIKALYEHDLSLQNPIEKDQSLPAEDETDGKVPMGYISSEELRFNSFLTPIVQQNIENLPSDLDEDAELVRFVFGYRRTNSPASVLETEENGVSCRTLTLEQVNETLEAFFGKTISPDREDYSILTESFHCAFHDGCFWNLSPYPAERFDFPLRFVLTEKIDQETNTVYFRLYQFNPDAWQVGEVERHVVLAPMMSIYELENGNQETKNWTIRLGRGTAVFRDLDGELQLVGMEITMNH